MNAERARPEEGAGSSGAQVTDDCELLDAGAGNQSEASAEQGVALKADSSLQPHTLALLQEEPPSVFNWCASRVTTVPHRATGYQT